MKGVKYNLVGRVFSYLTVVELAGKDRWNKSRWRCKCQCGRVLVVDGSKLTCSHTRSCGSGIKYPRSWNNFLIFVVEIESAIGPRPSRKHQIDRVDNNKSYSTRNIRWATPKQQANNRRNNTILTFKGVSRTVSQWADSLGIHQNTLIARLRRHPIPSCLRKKML